MRTYFDQFLSCEYQSTPERAVMLEAFVEFMPALVARALFESAAWPGALESIKPPTTRGACPFLDAAWTWLHGDLEKFGLDALSRLVSDQHWRPS